MPTTAVPMVGFSNGTFRMELRRGCNRLVLLTRRYAIKFPLPDTWRSILFGLLNNMNEAEVGRKRGCCPVLWSAPGGLAVVMPRADILSEDEFRTFDAAAFCEAHGVRAEHKADSFGRLAGRIVAVDYGW